MNLKIKNKGLQGYALANRAKYTDEELLIAIKAKDEYNELRKRNGELYKLHCLGEFVDKSQARRFFHQSYLPSKKKESEVGNGESDTEIPRSKVEGC